MKATAHLALLLVSVRPYRDGFFGTRVADASGLCGAGWQLYAVLMGELVRDSTALITAYLVVLSPQPKWQTYLTI